MVNDVFYSCALMEKGKSTPNMVVPFQPSNRARGNQITFSDPTSLIFVVVSIIKCNAISTQVLYRGQDNRIGNEDVCLVIFDAGQFIVTDPHEVGYIGKDPGIVHFAWSMTVEHSLLGFALCLLWSITAQAGVVFYFWIDGTYVPFHEFRIFLAPSLSLIRIVFSVPQ